MDGKKKHECKNGASREKMNPHTSLPPHCKIIIYCKYFKAKNLQIASSGNMSQLNELHSFLRDFAKIDS